VICSQAVFFPDFQMLEIIEAGISNGAKQVGLNRGIDLQFFLFLPEIKKHLLNNFLSLIYVIKVFSGIPT